MKSAENIVGSGNNSTGANEITSLLKSEAKELNERTEALIKRELAVLESEHKHAAESLRLDDRRAGVEKRERAVVHKEAKWAHSYLQKPASPLSWAHPQSPGQLPEFKYGKLGLGFDQFSQWKPPSPSQQKFQHGQLGNSFCPWGRSKKPQLSQFPYSACSDKPGACPAHCESKTLKPLDASVADGAQQVEIDRVLMDLVISGNKESDEAKTAAAAEIDEIWLVAPKKAEDNVASGSTGSKTSKLPTIYIGNDNEGTTEVTKEELSDMARAQFLCKEDDKDTAEPTKEELKDMARGQILTKSKSGDQGGVARKEDEQNRPKSHDTFRTQCPDMPGNAVMAARRSSSKATLSKPLTMHNFRSMAREGLAMELEEADIIVGLTPGHDFAGFEKDVDGRVADYVESAEKTGWNGKDVEKLVEITGVDRRACEDFVEQARATTD